VCRRQSLIVMAISSVSAAQAFNDTGAPTGPESKQKQ
jgi:hypothetical protein